MKTQKQVKQELVTKIIKRGGKIMKKEASGDGWYAYALLLEYINKQRMRA